MNSFCVVTTINKPTKAIEALYEKFGRSLIVVGDTKTPSDWDYRFTRYMNPCKRPLDSYARKNIGYLEAMRLGADLILSTDDDNIPNENWKIREYNVLANESVGDGWYNVYDVFSNEVIWARGFSLRYLNQEEKFGEWKHFISSIQQGLADGEPDVDAIWRLTHATGHSFKKRKSIYIQPYSWCPYNTQSTWFFKKAFPLMYLPVHANMRCADIWSSFIGQRCLWEIGEGVTFHSPSEVYQDRNEHDLLKDFEDEIPGYLKNDLIVEILSSLKLKQGEENMCDNLLTCYHALVNKNILPLEEINSLTQWIREYEEIAANMV